MAKTKFRYLPHTADLKVESEGKDLEEAFLNVALGGFNFLSDVSAIRPRIKKTLAVEAQTKEALLYDFLAELLFLLDTEGFFFGGAEHLTITRKGKGYELEASLLGDDYRKYETKGDIKAVTYSDMSITEGKQKTKIIVVYDI